MKVFFICKELLKKFDINFSNTLLGMWPTPENKDIHLDRCLRFLPHHNDDGGFFVALIKKVKPLPWEKDQTSANDSEVLTSGLSSRRVKYNILGKTPKPKSVPKVQVSISVISC